MLRKEKKTIVRKESAQRRRIQSPTMQRRNAFVRNAVESFGVETLEKMRVYLRCERCGATSTNGAFRKSAGGLEPCRTLRCSHCGYKSYAMDVFDMPVVPQSVPKDWATEPMQKLEQVLHERISEGGKANE